MATQPLRQKWFGRTALVAVLGLLVAQTALAQHIHLEPVDDVACVMCGHGSQDGAVASVSVEPVADAFEAQLGVRHVAPRADRYHTPYAPRDPPHFS